MIGKHNELLGIQDMYSRYPNLYVPKDFVRLEVDWMAATEVCVQIWCMYYCVYTIVYYIYCTAYLYFILSALCFVI